MSSIRWYGCRLNRFERGMQSLVLDIINGDEAVGYRRLMFKKERSGLGRVRKRTIYQSRSWQEIEGICKLSD